MDEDMTKVWKYLLLAIIVAGLISGLFMYFAQKSYVSYSLSDYSCEQVELSLSTGDCLLRNKNFMFTRCFETEERYVYYKLFCLEEVANE